MLRFHDEIRQWIGLDLDKTACGEDEIELFVDVDSLEGRRAKSLVGCHVKVTGRIYPHSTGYYSAAMAFGDPEVTPDATCHPKPIEPDYSLAPVSANLRKYRASITADYRGNGRVRVKAWREGTKPTLLSPWQAYVSYSFTGDPSVIYFQCAKGFEIRDPMQNPPRKEGIFLDGAMEAGTVLDGTGVNVLTYQCVRSASTSDKPRATHTHKCPHGEVVEVRGVSREPGRAERESRVTFYTAQNQVQCSLDFSSDDGEHGFGVVKAEWTPDGRYFVFSLASSGGHQAWHAPTEFYSLESGKVCSLDDYLDGAGVSEPNFTLKPPNTVSAEVEAGKPVAVDVKLDFLRGARGKRRQPPQCAPCSGGKVVRFGP